jgi:DNA (cytosine-5)-methyltransferase 1
VRVLDLFCGAGGASRGYADAWPDAEIVGVDINPQPNYPYTFVQGDAMTFPLDGFDFVHASPPCQDHSTVTGRSRKIKGEHGTKSMLQETLDRLRESSLPYVVENVEAAKADHPTDPIRLCGSSFGLNLRRHRKFWMSDLVLAPPCHHSWQTPRFRSLSMKAHKADKLASVVGVHGNINYAGEFPLRCKAMGIDWMTNAELVQSIPPAYTFWIATQLKGHDDH